ncbi:MAG TPA: matrixin family metalloprotease [Thermoanaerobaculia bacterium]|nr:matrixin family metalloprotease [Thermoanaerobaculia bacterium]
MRTKALLGWILWLACAGAAGATSYVRISDENLADQAEVIGVATVRDAGPALDGAAPATAYLVEFERVLKGYVAGGTVAVRVPGGEAADGTFLKVWGAPAFSPGDRAILFLSADGDGGYRVLHLMLGAFHGVPAGEEWLALRDLSEASDLSPAKSAEPARDFERFADWLADRAAGLERPADYVSKSGAALQTGRFIFNPYPDGRPLRWFRFDIGGSVSWKMRSEGQPGLGFADTSAAFQTALAAWTNDAASEIRYNYAGTTSSSGGLAGSDGVNGVLFEDPGDRHVPGGFNCPSGGVIALGAAYAQSGTRTWRGQSYHEIIEAEVVTNNGSECFFRSNPGGAAEVFAHELGHSLGLGHSTEREALMWAKAHNDGRGARLHADDCDAVATLYGDGPVPRPTDNPGDEPPAAPTGLTANVLGRSVELTWRAATDGEQDFLLEQKSGRAFREIRVMPGDSLRTVLDGLAPGKVHTFRLRARNAAGVSGYSNTVTVRMPARSNR